MWGGGGKKKTNPKKKYLTLKKGNFREGDPFNQGGGKIRKKKRTNPTSLTKSGGVKRRIMCGNNREGTTSGNHYKTRGKKKIWREFASSQKPEKDRDRDKSVCRWRGKDERRFGGPYKRGPKKGIRGKRSPYISNNQVRKEAEKPMGRGGDPPQMDRARKKKK